MREMMFRSATLASMISLAGCAVNVPHMGDVGTAPQQRILNEIDLLGHIQCELHVAYDHAKDVVEWENEQGLKLDPNAPMEDTSWIDGWGAKINLEFQVEAKSAFTPGLSITKPLQNAIRTFDNGPVTVGRTRGGKFGAGITRDITRTETIAYFFPFSNFKFRALPVRAKDQKPAEIDWKTECSQKTHITSDDNLQIYDFLHSKLELAATPGLLGQDHSTKTALPVPEPAAVRAAAIAKALLERKTKTPALAPEPADPDDEDDAAKGPKAPFSTLSYDVHFVVTKQASITPTWKLVEVAIDADGALYAGSRIKSDHLTMTFGAPEKGKPDKPSNELDQQHFARLIGQYVGDAVNGRRNQ